MIKSGINGPETNDNGNIKTKNLIAKSFKLNLEKLPISIFF